MAKPRIGLALGSGSARGWAHIGVIQALKEQGIEPDLVCGCSIGALVGASYCGDQLGTLEEWVRKLGFWDVVKLLDVRMSGGLIEGDSLMAAFADKIRDIRIEKLDKPFACVATDLQNGREIWLQQGSLRAAVRASIALPGLFSPVQHEGRWLLDGGLTNPVPVSLCRAMGADVIIAVNLNSDIIGRHIKHQAPRENADKGDQALLDQLLEKLNGSIKDTRLGAWANSKLRNHDEGPGVFDVVASAINIMQDRITKSRMAGDPPDVVLTPRLGKLGLLEFDRAEEAIAEGHDSVRRALPTLQHLIGR
ncbi:MAG: patatin-like phospholipase RssA [Gammaproteobacteria bacterium]|nr:patatin-like phospholipase RssA [Gammaproteobacteria bacterium]